MNNATEIILVKALSKGDKRAFKKLFLYYQPKLVYFLRGFIKDNDLARDMTQDIFFSLWNDKSKLSEIKFFQAYIFKMAKNAICNYYDHLIVNEKFMAEQFVKPALHAENTEELVFANQLQCMIDAAVSRMPPQRKQIYMMSRVEGLSNTKIAEKLNINKRTVENHITSALADLRKVVKALIIFFC